MHKAFPNYRSGRPNQHHDGLVSSRLVSSRVARSARPPTEFAAILDVALSAGETDACRVRSQRNVVESQTFARHCQKSGPSRKPRFPENRSETDRPRKMWNCNNSKRITSIVCSSWTTAQLCSAQNGVEPGSWTVLSKCWKQAIVNEWQCCKLAISETLDMTVIA